MDKFMFTLLILSICATQANSKTRSQSCLSEFDTNRTRFNVCQTSTCLVFRDDALFVIPGDNPPAGVPFPCVNRSELYPDLHGVSFQIQSEISAVNNAYCVFAAGCTFDDVPKFLKDAGSAYHFLTFGPLILTPTRIDNSSRPSVPLLSGRMQFLGPRTLPFGTAFGALLNALTWRGWLLVIVVNVLWLTIRAFIVWILGNANPFKIFRKFWSHFLDGNIKPQVPDEQKERYVWWLWAWRASFTCVTVLEVMVIEAGFISYLFNANTRSVNITKDLLRKVVVVVDSAEEYFLRRLATLNGIRGDRSWQIAENSSEVLQRILNSPDRARYALTYEQLTKNVLRRKGTCDKIGIYDTGEINLFYSAVFYYGPGIESSTSTLIDKRIQELVDSRQISGFLGLPEGDDTCGEQPLSVDWTVIVIPLCAMFVLFVVVLGVYLLLRKFSITRGTSENNDYYPSQPDELDTSDIHLQ